MTENRELLTVAEVATILGASPGFIGNLRRAGVLKPAATMGRMLRFKRSDVLALANGQSAARPADVVPCRRPGDELSER